MRSNGVMFHELPRDLRGEFGIQAALDIDIAQLCMFCVVVLQQCASFDIEISLFRICLRTHRDKFTGPHRQRPGDEAGKSRDKDCTLIHVRCRNPEQQTRNRQHAIICAEYARAQPSGSVCTMNMCCHGLSILLCPAFANIKVPVTGTSYHAAEQYGHGNIRRNDLSKV